MLPIMVLLFVSGMGLESEWRADVKLRGPVTAPEITGRVELVRGQTSRHKTIRLHGLTLEAVLTALG